jgi:hypothetical protein
MLLLWLGNGEMEEKWRENSDGHYSHAGGGDLIISGSEGSQAVLIRRSFW